MEKLISVAVMRTSDAAEIAGGTDSKTLMYRAGLGLFQSWDWHGKIDIVTGSGNNAGDGYVLALLLRQHGIPCRIVRTSEKVSPDGGYFFAKCEGRGIPVTDSVDFSHTDILVDCLLGTGFRGELRPSMRHIVEQINQSGAAVLSVDINSGMNGDSGDGFCVRSDRTVSIGCLKYGHLLGMAQGKIGSLYNYDIGIPCKGSYLPLFTGDDRTPESWDFVPAESFPQILDNFHIPAGEPAQRLQMLADALREKMQFFTVSDADALPYTEL